MLHRNPLVTETLKGLAGVGPIHLAYLNYLLIQAVVLFLWWPSGTVVQRLETEDGPDTLLAVVIALGATLAYYSIRAGAEEILLPGQHSLREWVIATPLKLGRILRGYLYAHVLQMLHAIMLSSPLLLMGYWVVGGEWSGLVWCLITVLLQATFYRLLGVLMVMTIGHYDTLMFVSLRVILALGYVFVGALVPITSHWLVSSQLLRAAPTLDAGGASLSPGSGFLWVYGLLCVLLAGALYWVLARHRRLSTVVVAQSEQVKSR